MAVSLPLRVRRNFPAALAGALVTLCCAGGLTGCVEMTPARPAVPRPPESPVLDRFTAARARELAAARDAIPTIQAATAALAPAEQVRMRGVAAAPFEAADTTTNQVRSVDAFTTLTVDLPLSLRGRPEHDQAMAPVKQLAELLAASRGSAEIVRAFTPADARNERITPGSATAKIGTGEEVTVTRVIDPELYRGFERIIVKGGPLTREQN